MHASECLLYLGQYLVTIIVIEKITIWIFGHICVDNATPGR